MNNFPGVPPGAHSGAEQQSQQATSHLENPHAAATAKPRPRRRLFVLALAAIVPLVTAVSVTIPLLAGLSETQTSDEAMRLDASSGTIHEDLAEKSALEDENFDDSEVMGEWTRYVQDPDTATDWRIPVDAPFDTFPLNFEGDEYIGLVCSSEQRDWLKEHAEMTGFLGPARTFTLTVRNSASTGGALALGNIRYIAEEVEVSPWVYFPCGYGGRGATGGMQSMKINALGEKAVYGEALSSNPDESEPEGSPVALNLDPGEVATLPLDRDGDEGEFQREYVGKIVADVLGGSQDETKVLAEDVTFSREPVPGYRLDFVPMSTHVPVPLAAGENPSVGEFLCTRPLVPRQEDEFGRVVAEAKTCTPTQVLQWLREAEQSVENE